MRGLRCASAPFAPVFPVPSQAISLSMRTIRARAHRLVVFPATAGARWRETFRARCRQRRRAGVVPVLALLLLATWSGLCAAAAGSRTDAALPSHRPGFRCVDALLRRIVDDVHPRTPQRLHLGPVETGDGGAFLRVYWPQQRAILLIDWPSTCTDADLQIDDLQLGWYRTKARIDLDTDVVPTPDDIHGSTYLVDKPWVDRVIAQCLAGETRVIRPSRRR